MNSSKPDQKEINPVLPSTTPPQITPSHPIQPPRSTQIQQKRIGLHRLHQPYVAAGQQQREQRSR
jgi:hypothetical protein